MIERPDLKFNPKTHSYYLDGKKLDGVSTVSKIGEDDIWGVASWWGFRIGYEGAIEILNEEIVSGEEITVISPEEMREALKLAKLTPNHKRDKAADRGNAIHDALEHLAQKGEVPLLEQYPVKQRGYIQALCAWFLDYRPEFVATEVQVVSKDHSFAGRYDVRCVIPFQNWRDEIVDGEPVPKLVGHDKRLCLIDLKTGKRVYPTSQFVQLAGYELASREMGYPATDAQFVLNVREDGSYEFARSCATIEDFLTYLGTHRTIKRIKEEGKK